MTTSVAVRLAVLLAPYSDLTDGQGPRLLDVPPAVAAVALELLPADQASARLNLVQPPMRWLVDVAAELDGRLVGVLAPGRGFVRFDGVQVPAVVAGALAERIAAAWPATGELTAALTAATAEAWTSWAADNQPMWTGTGDDVLAGRSPAGAVAVGLWWD